MLATSVKVLYLYEFTLLSNIYKDIFIHRIGLIPLWIYITLKQGVADSL